MKGVIEKAFLYYLKTKNISFPFPACKLVHCACVSIDCLVISFYDNLHSFVVRDLAYSFIYYIVLLEEMYDKWTTVVIITRVVYKTVWSQHYILPAILRKGVLSLGMNSVSTLYV